MTRPTETIEKSVVSIQDIFKHMTELYKIIDTLPEENLHTFRHYYGDIISKKYSIQRFYKKGEINECLSVIGDSARAISKLHLPEVENMLGMSAEVSSNQAIQEALQDFKLDLETFIDTNAALQPLMRVDLNSSDHTRKM